ncbi:Nickel/cobalt efflux system rcnA [Kluyvera cryocrescens]|uniref:Nickel/cobalt efflux system n=1 Tax=Kluyvera cryocrescens TaxID=580 RepID=A0A485D004_KLUCR|nr:Nickel/cobalt efflux system rcnA [Kluyvera cryocrescens]
MAGCGLAAAGMRKPPSPWFQLLSGIIIIAIALWMLWRTWRESRGAHNHDHSDHHGHSHHHDHSDHAHDHHHHDEHHHGALVDADWQDAHQRAHAEEINRRFTGQQVTTGQIMLFGLTGGLIPCPASITILLICLQLKHVALGATLVLSFSVGLALTLVASGAIAAISLKHMTKRWSGFGELSRKAPWFSGALIILVGIYMMAHGISALA